MKDITLSYTFDSLGSRLEIKQNAFTLNEIETQLMQQKSISVQKVMLQCFKLLLLYCIFVLLSQDSVRR